MKKENKNHDGTLKKIISELPLLAVLFFAFVVIPILTVYLFVLAKGDLNKQYFRMERYYFENVETKQKIDKDLSSLQNEIENLKQQLSPPKITEEEQQIYRNLTIIEEQINLQFGIKKENK